MMFCLSRPCELLCLLTFTYFIAVSVMYFMCCSVTGSVCFVCCVFVNYLVKQFAICLRAVVILLLNAMEVFSVGEGALLARPCMGGVILNRSRSEVFGVEMLRVSGPNALL